MIPCSGPKKNKNSFKILGSVEGYLPKLKDKGGLERYEQDGGIEISSTHPLPETSIGTTIHMQKYLHKR